ncbi:MotA/TolQ/ExbB proton channel family protein [Maridesulfovibrio sp.]|uniref:MotA/TolQ/ExbB proton channel family protein n=1 Tax=Maridesulfovibrio sp. TaxID=2795000 RepID=UPI0029CA18AB|nr:MotA/TolQ/ExbB proton channel family protein [Maridesulfovibrio sp.]
MEPIQWIASLFVKASPVPEILILSAIWIVFSFVIGLYIKFNFRVEKGYSKTKLQSAISNADSLSLKVQKAYYSAYQDESSDNTAAQPFFLKDAVYQYGQSAYYDEILSKYENLVNLLPPMGFLGTVVGMLLLFIGGDGGVKNSLSSVGMGTALLTTVFALFSYIVFELLKIRLDYLADKCIKLAIQVASEAVIKEDKEATSKKKTSYITIG